MKKSLALSINQVGGLFKRCFPDGSVFADKNDITITGASLRVVCISTGSGFGKMFEVSVNQDMPESEFIETVKNAMK